VYYSQIPKLCVISPDAVACAQTDAHGTYCSNVHTGASHLMSDKIEWIKWYGSTSNVKRSRGRSLLTIFPRYLLLSTTNANRLVVPPNYGQIRAVLLHGDSRGQNVRLGSMGLWMSGSRPAIIRYHRRQSAGVSCAMAQVLTITAVPLHPLIASP
jgi:hypothetical protein